MGWWRGSSIAAISSARSQPWPGVGARIGAVVDPYLNLSILTHVSHASLGCAGCTRLAQRRELIDGAAPSGKQQLRIAALRAPYTLGDARALEELLSPSLDDVRVEQVDGTARFASIDDWIYTEIRGWTLADAIDDEQFERLRSEARSRLVAFADAAGRVAFPAPALIASGRARQLAKS